MKTDPTPNGGITNEELAEQLYNMLMRDIEPDLLTYNLPKLDEYYTGETEAEHDNRMVRYQNAYKAFTKAHREFMNLVTNEVQKAQRETRSEAEATDNKAEAAAEAQVLSSILDS